MKNYELLAIIKPNIDSDEADSVLSKIEETVKSLGGSVISMDKIGRKKLSYEIKSYRDAYYTSFVIDLDPAQVSKFKTQLTYNENILRTIFMEVNAVKA